MKVSRKMIIIIVSQFNHDHYSQLIVLSLK